jgi:lactate dehydrogenase-like 2-hydroxyacid dehydrogenase
VLVSGQHRNVGVGAAADAAGANAGAMAEAAANHVPLDELLGASDIVTLHVPLSADTRHIIGCEQLEAMRQGVFLVNTGRGALVDTDALIAALEGRKLGGAALDVLEGEEGYFYLDCTHRPIANRFLSKLQKMPNVVITPHTAYHTERALRETVEATIRNCVDFIAGPAGCQAQGPAGSAGRQAYGPAGRQAYKQVRCRTHG